MEIDWLRTFVTAAKYGHFHKTAGLLHMAQPTVTLHIQKLEQSLGVSLFEREGRRVTLSASGRRFLPQAQAVLDAADGAREDMHRWRQGYSETLSIAASPLVATTFLPRWIEGYTAMHPHTQFSILVRESDQMVSTLLEGVADLAFSRLEVHHPNVQCVELYADPVVFVVPAAEDIDAAPRTIVDWLTEYPLLTHNHPTYWEPLLASLRRVVPDLRTMNISQVHVTVHWITEQLGVSFLPYSTVRRELLRGTVLEIPGPDSSLLAQVTFPVAHTYMLSRLHSKSGFTFAEHVSNYMRIRS